MESFVTLINGFQSVTNGTKNSILESAVMLYMYTYWSMHNADYLYQLKKNPPA